MLHLYLIGTGLIALALSIGILYQSKKQATKSYEGFLVTLDAMREEELIDVYKQSISKQLQKEIIKKLKSKYSYGDKQIKRMEDALQERQYGQYTDLRYQSPGNGLGSSSNSENRTI